MALRISNPGFRPATIFLVGLALSVGWGIRGNYGHELGAMFPGAIAAICACLLSGRDDWRERVAYFAFFGAVGWGFGGSMSYMQVISYTHSGHEPTQLYGFAGLFLLGFLWAAIGGGATALPAVLDRRRLTEMFWPLAWLFLLWAVMYFVLPWLFNRLQELQPDAMQRHENLFYWFDTDWLEVFVILIGLLLFDLVDRRFEKSYWLLLCLAVGAGIGFAVQYVIRAAGWAGAIENNLVRYQGDLERFEPEQLLTNWPNFVDQTRDHLGWGIGLLLGLGVYFAIWGKFRRGSSLFVHMALGWFAGFILLPVLLDVRLTPPRGDNWAGILGMFVGAMIYLLRHRLIPVALVSVVCGIVGGIGFAGIAWLKLMLLSFGNPAVTDDPAVIQAWHHWHSANWHSFLEQSYGFVNGVGLMLALALLITRLPKQVDPPESRSTWTEIFALMFVLPVLSYVNMVKNVDGWTDLYGGTIDPTTQEHLNAHRPIPETMQAPWFDSIEMSAWAWFSVFYLIVSLGLLTMMIVHKYRPLAMISRSWVGRGQLLFFVLTWVFVIGNFGRALVSFSQGRLITEGTVLVNAVLATMLLLVLPVAKDEIKLKPSPRWHTLLWSSVVVGLLIAGGLPFALTYSVRSIYGDQHAGHAGREFRFGDDANWRVKPLLRGELHR